MYVPRGGMAGRAGVEVGSGVVVLGGVFVAVGTLAVWVAKMFAAIWVSVARASGVAIAVGNAVGVVKAIKIAGEHPDKTKTASIAVNVF